MSVFLFVIVFLCLCWLVAEPTAATPVGQLSSPPTIPLAQLPTPALRQECRRLGIGWRNAHGRNRHLKAHEMRQAIAAHINNGLCHLADMKSTLGR